MKALSIRQPWAAAILVSGKRCENREWDSRGGNLAQARALIGSTIAIHAGKGCTRAEYEDAIDFMTDIGVVESNLPPPIACLARGAIVGRVRLASVIYTLNSGHRTADVQLRNGQRCILCGGDYSAGSCPTPDPWAIPRTFGLILTDVEALAEPVPFAGALGFFNVPDGMVKP